MPSKDICKHGLYGNLCHKCFPEKHTYLALLGTEYKIFTASGWEEALKKGEKLNADGVFHRIFRLEEYGNHAPKKQEPNETEQE